MRTTTPGIVLVLGLTGALGAAVGKALADRGWTVRALTRRPPADRPGFPFAVDWREGDALDGGAVAVAAEGASLIVHGVNPPGYRRWREDGLPMLANTIAAARAQHATILFPANVYVFSAASPAIVDEEAPRVPTTRKGRVRLEMEQMLAQASAQDGVRAIVVRAGDFFGPGAEHSWFGRAVAKGGRRTRTIRTLAAAGVGHAWAFVPDLAETFARLADRRAELPAFTLVHFAGHFDATGRDLAEAVRRAIGNPRLPIRPFPWIAIRLAAPFVRLFAELGEMTWLWNTSLALDNGRLVHLLGDEPHTPLDQAVAAALG